MKKFKIITALILTSIFVLSGCQQKEEKTEVTLAPPTEKTMVLEDIEMRAETVYPYDGIYIERGDDENKDRVEGVYALAFTNTAEKTIKEAHLVFNDGTQDLNFHMQMLPFGKTVTVVEYDKKPAVSEELKLVDSEIIYLQEGMADSENIRITSDGYGALMVENRTLTELPKLEIYYRRSYENGTLGGPCYCVTLEDMQGTEVAFPEAEYWSDHSEVVNILIYPDLSQVQ